MSKVYICGNCGRPGDEHVMEVDNSQPIPRVYPACADGGEYKYV